MINIDAFDALFFDFDGVLVDSVPVKTEAYAEIFAPYGTAAVERIIDYHRAHGGVDRFRKIAHVLSTLDKHEEATVQAMALQFSNLVVDKVVACPWIEAGRQILFQAREAGISCFVVSGTPESELLDIVQRRGMQDLFESINGSPRAKTEILLSIIQGNEYERDRCLMIGDASTDFFAAQSARIWFFGFPEISNA